MRFAGRCAGHCATRSKSACFLSDFARIPIHIFRYLVGKKSASMILKRTYGPHVKKHACELTKENTHVLSCLPDLFVIRAFVPGVNLNPFQGTRTFDLGPFETEENQNHGSRLVPREGRSEEHTTFQWYAQRNAIIGASAAFRGNCD